MEIRLQKYLSDAGIASRRKAEEFIAQGRVTVNGEIADEPGRKVAQTDQVFFDGKKVEPRKEAVYLMIHKPEGYITSTRDQFNRPSVMDLLTDVKTRLYPVGRLDYDTSGLLLMTNDGELTYALTHPKHQVEKTYIARVKGVPVPETLRQFREGLSIEDYRTAPAKIQIVKTVEGGATLKITIHEGKNRQVRKMCEAIGHPVVFLKRIATGKLYLGELAKGNYRALTPEEVKYVKSLGAVQK